MQALEEIYAKTSGMKVRGYAMHSVANSVDYITQMDRVTKHIMPDLSSLDTAQRKNVVTYMTALRYLGEWDAVADRSELRRSLRACISYDMIHNSSASTVRFFEHFAFAKSGKIYHFDNAATLLDELFLDFITKHDQPKFLNILDAVYPKYVGFSKKAFERENIISIVFKKTDYSEMLAVIKSLKGYQKYFDKNVDFLRHRDNLYRCQLFSQFEKNPTVAVQSVREILKETNLERHFDAVYANYASFKLRYSHRVLKDLNMLYDAYPKVLKFLEASTEPQTKIFCEQKRIELAIRSSSPKKITKI